MIIFWHNKKGSSKGKYFDDVLTMHFLTLQFISFELFFL